ncbi:MAG TPA: uracil-DNA glycosylase, partial [Sphingomonas sp.]|nr:uracil-DNA glycosylase [Sphingomonas sp.]
MLDREAAASLIRWWRDAGVDTLVEDAPRDWLARAAERPAATTRPAPAAETAAAPAGLPGTLDGLLAWLRDSADAPEARWGRARVLPSGNPQSELMILIDAPEAGDAEAGRLLSGELGALFDRMLAAIKRDRGSVWLASFATIRPLGRVPQ